MLDSDGIKLLVANKAEVVVPEITPIEKIVLQALAHGMQSKEIAHALRRKKPTVEGYIRILYAKFGARSRAQLVACAYRCGLVE